MYKNKIINGYEYNRFRYLNNDPVKVVLNPNDLFYNLSQIQNPDNHINRNILNFPNVVFLKMPYSIVVKTPSHLLNRSKLREL
jgi:hypothetical protein